MGQQNRLQGQQGLLFGVWNQAELFTKFPSQMWPLSCPCTWKKLVVGISTWAKMQVGTWSAKVQVLVAVSFVPFAITIWSPVLKFHRCPSRSLWGETWVGLPESDPQCWESWMSTLGSLFPIGETISQGSFLVWCCASLAEGQCGQSEAPLTLLMWSFSVSVVQGSASLSSLCLGIFTMVSCLWIVVSCFSCKADWSQEQTMSPPLWLYCFI